MNDMNTLIELAGNPVYICSDGFEHMQVFFSSGDMAHRRKFIMVDENTMQYCLPRLIDHVPALADAEVIEVESGEDNKVPETCVQLWHYLMDSGADKASVMINLGGGMVCDMGGFVASTWHRGIPFVQIPTTLLSQVDAAVGGKTAVNLGQVKNQIGTFSHPAMVFIETTFLDTLPHNQLLSGYAEMLKHGLIRDVAYWDYLVQSRVDDAHDWYEKILPSVKIKSHVVCQDPEEKGLRKLLNFGHTIGHALEAFSGVEGRQGLSHGHAVAIGMLVEAWLSVRHATLSEEQYREIVHYIKGNYDMYYVSAADIDELMVYVGMDKKQEQGKSNMTLLNAIGQGVFNVDVQLQDVRLALEQYAASVPESMLR